MAGIYQTNMTKFDQALCFTDLYTARNLNGWKDTDTYSGAEMTVTDFEMLNLIAYDWDEDGKADGKKLP